jgi:AcrR family transcriptional regulator
MDAQREKIIRAAIECIGDKGIERTSISDICRKAELSAGALYVHFSNKDEIILAALRYGSMTDASLPESWEEFKTMVASLDDQLGFDIATVVRVRLHLHAESARPGTLHDVYKPFLKAAIRVLSDRLQLYVERGEIVLRMSADQTALSMSAFIDGVLWNAFATDRPLKEIKTVLMEGLELFVSRPRARR